MQRLDDAERQLLKPGPSGLGSLVENLEASWHELCAIQHAVRGGVDPPGRRAELSSELKVLRLRLSRLTMLLDHARALVGAGHAPGGSLFIGATPSAGVLRHLDEEG